MIIKGSTQLLLKTKPNHKLKSFDEVQSIQLATTEMSLKKFESQQNAEEISYNETM